MAEELLEAGYQAFDHPSPPLGGEYRVFLARGHITVARPHFELDPPKGQYSILPLLSKEIESISLGIYLYARRLATSSPFGSSYGCSLLKIDRSSRRV